MIPRLASTLRFEDDWYAVQKIDQRTYAIGEPLYHQQNWSYLLLGDDRSLLFDTGSFCRDITGVVGRLAPRELTVLPSHMHYDHLGNIVRFNTIAVADLPILRDCVSDGLLTPSDPLFLPESENNVAPSFAVREWLAIGDEIDLGGRVLTIAHTPGHSPDSISLIEAGGRRIFAADFIYPGDLYAQVPGASLPEYLQTCEALTKVLDPRVQIYCAHGNKLEEQDHSAPLLAYDDLEDLMSGLNTIEQGLSSGKPPEAFMGNVALSENLNIRIDKDALGTWGERS